MSCPHHLTGAVMPPAIAALPKDARGYPIPYFASYDGSRPRFDILDPARVVDCVERRLCGICGRKLAALCWYIGGPKTLAARLSADPPMHFDCAQFAITACPHLTFENARYRDDKTVREIDATPIPAADGIKPDHYYVFAVEKSRFDPRLNLIALSKPRVTHRYDYNAAGRLVHI